MLLLTLSSCERQFAQWGTTTGRHASLLPAYPFGVVGSVGISWSTIDMTPGAANGFVSLMSNDTHVSSLAMRLVSFSGARSNHTSFFGLAGKLLLL